MKSIRNIGVVGAGTMGVGVSVDLILHGMNVILIDTSDEILEEAKVKILEKIRFMPLIKKRSPVIEEARVLDAINLSTNLEELKTSDFVIENATESWEIKEGIYRKIDQICRPDVCFGVNTSCISITKVGGVTKRPDQIIGIHLMNPVYLKEAVEVIKGFHTSEETIAITEAFLQGMGKKTILVNDYPGFVSNRISHLFMNEAAFSVQDGLASPEKIDQIFKECYGHTMGPLETADLIGLDTVVNSLDVLYQSYQDPKYRCCPLLKKMTEAGLLGKKSGQGFYEYN